MTFDRTTEDCMTDSPFFQIEFHMGWLTWPKPGESVRKTGGKARISNEHEYLSAVSRTISFDLMQFVRNIGYVFDALEPPAKA
jgi:hypothetical protein